MGAGIGGLVTAGRLRKKLPREHRIVLIDREADHVFAPSFLWLMTGRRTRESISRPLAKLPRRGIEVIHGEIESIDPQNRAVRVNGQTLAGDYLVIALGAELAPETIPGLAPAGHNFYTLTGAESLREARMNFLEG
ncbi:MAG: FAD-dependent oxidoreductase, partial [Burkholderiales bacterium]|nr:FAD-dependent oxidoreductase [Burkholderiales bacterium]